MAAAALNHELSAILVTAKAPAKLGEFLLNSGLTEVDQVGLLASDEDKLEAKVFPTLKAAGVPTEGLGEQIGIKKAWMLRRARMLESKSTRAAPAKAEEDVLPAPTRENLVQTFKREHKFQLSGERLLTEQLIKQIYTELHSSPRKLSIYLLENLRVQSAINLGPRNLGVSRDLRPGEPIVVEEFVADEVFTSMQIFERSRAFFSTVAYVCVNDPSFFGLQDLIYMEDKILELLQFTKDKRRPPVQHFVAAWALTLRFFSDEIRTSGRALSTLIRETASWQSNWTSWSPPSSPPSSSHGPAANPSQREKELERMLTNARREAAGLQSERDRLAAKSGRNDRGRDRAYSPRRDDRRDTRDRTPKRDNGNGKGKGKGKKGDRDNRRR